MALDKPERTLNQRYMRRIGDSATEACTYQQCADFAASAGRAIFNKTFIHRAFSTPLEQNRAYTTLATYSSGTARKFFMYLWNDKLVHGYHRDKHGR
eukprot:8249000-Karenia_brevis.AAC.1